MPFPQGATSKSVAHIFVVVLIAAQQGAVQFYLVEVMLTEELISCGLRLDPLLHQDRLPLG